MTAFAGRVVLVTGASSGIGAELARQLCAAGAKVALAARDGARLEAVATECRERARAAGAPQGDAFVVVGDVTDQASCASLVQRTVDHFGQLDILVNNAGMSMSARFDEITDLSIFERLMRVNYLGSVWCTSYALPHLKRVRGQIVAVSSLTGLTGVPRRTAYGATKHAMAGFFDALRIELARDGVAVTVIYPGFVFSEINTRALTSDGTPFGDKAYVRKKGETMETDEACRQMLRAIARRDRDLIMTRQAKIARILKLLSPSIVDRIARKEIEKRQ